MTAQQKGGSNMRIPQKLDRDFYLRDTVTVAKSLLGKHIVRVMGQETLVAEILETEAYDGLNDKACHSYGNKLTPRTRVMYELGGHAYIYQIYGLHFLFNVVTGKKHDPCSVMIRTARAVEGQDRMAFLRYGKEYGKLSRARQRAMLSGPANICKAMGIGREQNGDDLRGEGLFLAEPSEAHLFEIGTGVRINIDYAEEAAEYPYRFFVIP
jgi:DNA-3-methyladenine glycosylase